MAGDGITVAQLRQLLGVQAELREQAETCWRQAQRALVALLETFAPEEVDRRLKSGQPLDSLKVDELGMLVNQSFQDRLRRENGRVRGESLQPAPARDEKEELLTENRRLKDEGQVLRAECERLAHQLDALRQATAAQIAVPLPQAPEAAREQSPLEAGAPEPEWMRSWRLAETFERDAATLRLLGETGLARRPQAEARAAQNLGIRKPGGSLQALFNRLVDQQLIEIFRPWDSAGAKTGGRAPDLLRLTERGRLAYWLLSGVEPTENEYDALLPRHVSPEHTLLNLQAADFLREAGCRVEMFPGDIHLAGGGLYRPDLLAATPEGEVLYIEVEAEANKNREQRQAKWRNCLQAGGGQIYVFCDNRSCMRAVRSEINYCLGREAARCHLTNLADLQAGLRAADGGIWLDVRAERVAGIVQPVYSPGVKPGLVAQTPGANGFTPGAKEGNDLGVE
jgi:hypothetical protein